MHCKILLSEKWAIIKTKRDSENDKRKEENASLAITIQET